ncbi:MAG: hypothetical protein ACLS7Z_03765 [Christensenellales bacterium]
MMQRCADVAESDTTRRSATSWWRGWTSCWRGWTKAMRIAAVQNSRRDDRHGADAGELTARHLHGGDDRIRKPAKAGRGDLRQNMDRSS